MPKNKPYSTPVEAQLAAQLLNTSGEREEGGLLGDKLATIANELEGLVEEANKFLEDSEFATMVADTLARKANKRGWPRIAVESSGKVVLEISYQDPGKKKPKRARRVPLLDELRAEAEEMGVDISGFGIKRRAIYEHLQKIRGGESPGKPPEPSKKPKKPKAPPVVKKAQDEPEPDPGPMSAGVDEVKISPALEGPKPPKKAGFVKTGDAVKPVLLNQDNVPDSEETGKKHDLRALVEQSKDVDIEAILASEPPQK
jgi:hypothetical protein